MDDRVITDANGRLVWDLNAYPFLEEEAAPPSVNPSLWRQSRLNALYHGLFKVNEGVYQIRNFDLSVKSIIESNTGYVVVDPLISAETARAGMGLVYRHAGQKPIVAVIYTHSHVDHWGGVKGVISEADVNAGKIKVITLNAIFTDVNEQYLLMVENGVLNYAKGKQADRADATLTTTRAALDEVVLGEATLTDKLAAGEANIEGSQEKLVEFLSLMDNFEFWFNIVTP